MVEIQRLFQEVRKEAKVLSWDGTFEQYLNMAIENPSIARLSHTRIYDMIMGAGTKPGLYDIPIYELFSGNIFGIDNSLDRLVQFLHASAQGLEVRKRIFLLLGPPASGKSSIVEVLKKGLEQYSRTDEGAMYTIDGCPLQEEPLHLVPAPWREELAQNYALYIEGDLCPRCLHTLNFKYNGDISKVKIKRVTYSQTQGLGIGSFVATDRQGQDLSRLVGTVDPSLLGQDRLDGAGLAFRLDGELEAANRGIMEFIEIFKSDDRFLTVLLGVTQEQVIKLGGFGSVYADEAIIAHSNEEEYNTFISNKQTEALRDRMIVVKVPYNLRVSEEIKIYQKLVAESKPGGPHLAPLTLRVVAQLAILSRLEFGQPVSGLPKLSPIEKMKLYDSMVQPPYTKSDLERIHQSSTQEGMIGLSPRYVINRVADAMTRHTTCLTPLIAINSLLEGTQDRAGDGTEGEYVLSELIKEELREYKDLAVREVQRASVEHFNEEANNIYTAYGRDAETFCYNVDRETVEAPESPPLDQHLLRRVEGALYLREKDRVPFRREVCRINNILERQGKSLAYTSIPVLQIAIENLLFPRTNDLKPLLGQKRLRLEREQRRLALRQRLTTTHGYCDLCVDDLLEFVGNIVHSRDVVSIRNGKLIWKDSN